MKLKANPQAKKVEDDKVVKELAEVKEHSDQKKSSRGKDKVYQSRSAEKKIEQKADKIVPNMPAKLLT